MKGDFFMNNENELDTTKEEKALNWILIVMVVVQILTGITFMVIGIVLAVALSKINMFLEFMYLC